MVNLNSNRLVIALNVNGLNTPMKRQWLPDWIENNITTTIQLYATF